MCPLSLHVQTPIRLLCEETLRGIRLNDLDNLEEEVADQIWLPSIGVRDLPHSLTSVIEKKGYHVEE